MMEKFRAARFSVRLDILAASIIIVAAIAGAVFIWNSRPSEPKLTPEDVARSWAENNLDSAASDEIVKFIVSISNARQPELFSEYLGDRLHHSTSWSYSPALKLSSNRYEVVATASTNLHDIAPTVILDDRVPVSVTQVITMPFHLAVDMESKSVVDWSARTDEAFSYSAHGDSPPNAITLEEMYGEAPARCIRSVLEKGVSQSVAEILYMPPTVRNESETTRLHSALSAVELDAECQEWVGSADNS